MPASSIGEFILRPILEFVLEFVCYYIGRLIVPILSLGHLKCDRIAADTPRQKLRWGGLFHRRGQQIYLTTAATSLAGVLFITLVIAGGFLIYRSRS